MHETGDGIQTDMQDEVGQNYQVFNWSTEMNNILWALWQRLAQAAQA